MKIFFKIAVAVFAVSLAACSSPPDDGPKVGQLVFLKTTCEKLFVISWNQLADNYYVEDTKGNRLLREPSELSTTVQGCINWGKS